jgi:hypothetical protein
MRFEVKKHSIIGQRSSFQTHQPIWASEDTKDLIQKIYKRVRSLTVGYSARIKDSHMLETGRVREVLTKLNTGV